MNTAASADRSRDEDERLHRATVASATAQRCFAHRAASPSSLDCRRSEVRSLRKPPAVKAFRPIGRASAGHRCYARSPYARTERRRCPRARTRASATTCREKPSSTTGRAAAPTSASSIDGGFQAFNAGRLSEACHIFTDKMLAPENDTTIGLTVAGALTPGRPRRLRHRADGPRARRLHHQHRRQPLSRPALRAELHAAPRLAVPRRRRAVRAGHHPHLRRAVSRDGAARDRRLHPRFPRPRRSSTGPISTSELHYRLGLDLLERHPGCEEYSVVARAALRRRADLHLVAGRQLDRHEHRLSRADERQHADDRSQPDVNEVCAIILAGKQNGCVILGGGSPKNFYLQGQPTLWEVYGIPKGGNDYFIQITTDQVVWGGLSGATPAEAVSWGKVNPGVLPDTVVAYCDSTIAFPALLRVRRRLASTTAGRARSSCTSATRSSPTCCGRRKQSRETRTAEPIDGEPPEFDRHR